MYAHCRSVANAIRCKRCNATTRFDTAACARMSTLAYTSMRWLECSVSAGSHIPVICCARSRINSMRSDPSLPTSHLPTVSDAQVHPVQTEVHAQMAVRQRVHAFVLVHSQHPSIYAIIGNLPEGPTLCDPH
ncbi:hypothetical protein M3J09_006043 [Ascochyta lentis]